MAREACTSRRDVFLLSVRNLWNCAERSRRTGTMGDAYNAGERGCGLVYELNDLARPARSRRD